MKSRKTGHILFIAFAAAGALTLVWSRSAAVESAYPLEHAKNVWTRCVWSRVVGIFHGSAMAAENIRLKTELASLQVGREAARRLEVENVRLRQALGFRAERGRGGWLPAEVLSRGGGAAGVAGDVLRVDKGTLAGVREGEIVVAPEGLVGRVRSVTPHTAEVVTLVSPSLRMLCEVEGTGQPSRGILSGGSLDVLRLRRLRAADDVRPSLAVVTSGRGEVFPRGLRIGTILAVVGSGEEAEATVKPSVDFCQLEVVFICREK